MKYGRGTLTMCSNCSVFTAKPDIVTMEICKHAITQAGFTPTSHEDIIKRDAMITTALTAVFNQCRLPNSTLFTHIADQLHFNSLTQAAQLDAAPFSNTTNFDPSNPHPITLLPMRHEHAGMELMAAHPVPTVTLQHTGINFSPSLYGWS